MYCGICLLPTAAATAACSYGSSQAGKEDRGNAAGHGEKTVCCIVICWLAGWLPPAVGCQGWLIQSLSHADDSSWCCCLQQKQRRNERHSHTLTGQQVGGEVAAGQGGRGGKGREVDTSGRQALMLLC